MVVAARELGWMMNLAANTTKKSPFVDGFKPSINGKKPSRIKSINGKKLSRILDGFAQTV
jgi:hypothetical protein